MTDSFETPSSDPLRLNKHLAVQLGVSRREADNLIGSNRVTINSIVARLGARFRSGDVIAINGKPLGDSVNSRYVVFNKPIGYVCSRKPQGDVPTIYELLPPEYQALKPAGRLDKNSSGLLLLTNDGDFAYKMTHPKFNKTKQYEITLSAELAPLHQQMISDHGIQLEDGISQLNLERASVSTRKQWRVVMHEGRNRQIRRTFGALGYTIKVLHRTHFGNYTIGDIQPGMYETTNMR